MNVIKSNGSYKIYGNKLEVNKKLEAKVYNLQFSTMTGFYLTEHDELTINEKIYGNSEYVAEKILNGFEKSNRNFGTIISGEKGIGKTLITKILANKANQKNIPLLLVQDYIEGIAQFLSEIKQEIIVLFDEFEKNFEEKEKFDPQIEFLPLFDGVDSGKKCFVITCNKVYKLNEFFINRPGRFHYHFVIKKPSVKEIEEYLKDNLLEKYYDNIEKIISLSFDGDITYDCLRAICFEINNGYSLEETINDLNIERDTRKRQTIEVVTKTGKVINKIIRDFDIGSKNGTVGFIVDCKGEDICINFNVGKKHRIGDKYIVDKDDLTFYRDCIRGENRYDFSKEQFETINNIARLEISENKTENLNYIV